MIKGKYLQWLIGAILVVTFVSPAHGGKWRLVAKDQGVQALAPRNVACSPSLQIIISTRQAADFSGSKTKVKRVLDLARAKLSAECPQVKKIIISGQARRKEVYRGEASESGNWALSDLSPASTSTPSDTSDPCRTADPKVFEDVFRCMVSGRYPDRAHDCRTMIMLYKSRLREVGYMGKELEDRVPYCEIFAQVAKEMYGDQPYWASCTGYDGKKDAKIHLEECLSAFVPKYYGNKNKLKQITGCEQVRIEYEKALRSADQDGKLPAGYTPPDCGDANALVAVWTGKNPDTHPCAGFDSGDVAGHISKCFGPSSMRPFLANVRSCPEARKLYEQKLREAYGGLPPGYSMARCTEMEPLLAMAENYRKEVALKAQERERQRVKRERQRINERNNKINEMFAGKQPAGSAAPSDTNIAAQPEEVITECDRLAAHPGDPERPGQQKKYVSDDNLDVQSAIEACIEAVKSSPDNMRYKFQLGRVLAVGGAYEEAVSFLQEASDSGSAAAKFYLSDLYATGHGFPENMQMAQKLYDEAIAGGFCPVDLSQFGWPVFLQAIYEGKTKYFADRPLGAMRYIQNLNTALGESTYYASDQAALLRVYDPTLNNVIERKELANSAVQKQKRELSLKGWRLFLDVYRGAYKEADGGGLTLEEVRQLGSKDGKLLVYLFNDNLEVFMKLYDGIKRFVHEEL